MKKGLLVRIVLAVAPALFVLVVGLLLGTIVLLAPQIPVSVWGLTWRIAVALGCLGIVCYILNFGQRRKEVGLGKTTGLKSGTWSVVCGKVDTISPEAGNGREHRVRVVLTVRPMGDDSDEYHFLVIPKERLIKGNLANSARAITENYPSFCLRVESDGTRVLFQETAEAVRLHELVFSP